MFRSLETCGANVFLPAHVVADRRPTKSDPLVGLVHFWAHVRATKGDENCLATI